MWLKGLLWYASRNWKSEKTQEYAWIAINCLPKKVCLVSSHVFVLLLRDCWSGVRAELFGTIQERVSSVNRGPFPAFPALCLGACEKLWSLSKRKVDQILKEHESEGEKSRTWVWRGKKLSQEKPCFYLVLIIIFMTKSCNKSNDLKFCRSFPSADTMTFLFCNKSKKGTCSPKCVIGKYNELTPKDKNLKVSTDSSIAQRRVTLSQTDKNTMLTKKAFFIMR